MSDLLSRAIQIKSETTPKANTATRVGSLFQDVVTELENITGSTIFSLETEISGNSSNIENLNSDINLLESDIDLLEEDLSGTTASLETEINVNVNDINILSGITENIIEKINIKNVTYSELVTLINNSGLTEGQYYKISDFQTVHYILAGAYGEVALDEFGDPVKNEGPIEPLMVLATSNKTISKQAYSELYPQDIIHYEWDPYLSNLPDDGDVPGFINDPAFASWDTWGDPIDGWKGVITYREDTYFENIVNYDFRHVKFRRYKPNVVEYNSGVTYSIGQLAMISDQTGTTSIMERNAVYISAKNGNTGNLPYANDGSGFYDQGNQWWVRCTNLLGIRWDASYLDYVVPESGIKTSYFGGITYTADMNNYLDVTTFYPMSTYDYGAFRGVKFLGNLRDNYNYYLQGDLDSNVTNSLLSNNVFYSAGEWKNIESLVFHGYTTLTTWVGYHWNNIFLGRVSDSIITGDLRNNTFSNLFVFNLLGMRFMWWAMEENFVNGPFMYNKTEGFCDKNNFNGEMEMCITGNGFVANSLPPGELYNVSFGKKFMYNDVKDGNLPNEITNARAASGNANIIMNSTIAYIDNATNSWVIASIY